MARPPRPRVFLDTNVIFSAFRSAAGPPAEILRLHIDGRIEIVVSSQVLEELARAITAKLPAKIDALRRLLLSAPPEVVADPPQSEVDRWARLVNPVDAPIIAAAPAAEVDYFVTGDRDFLASATEIPLLGIAVASPREFIDSLE